MTVRYRRAEGAAGRRVGASLFLASDRGGTLVRVSSSVAAVWNLLEKPSDSQGILEVFRAAFPATPVRRLRATVAMILRDLVSEGLLERRSGRGGGSRVRRAAGRAEARRDRRRRRA